MAYRKRETEIVIAMFSKIIDISWVSKKRFIDFCQWKKGLGFFQGEMVLISERERQLVSVERKGNIQRRNGFDLSHLCQ